jgi:hypothetical protein
MRASLKALAAILLTLLPVAAIAQTTVADTGSWTVQDPNNTFGFGTSATYTETSAQFVMGGFSTATPGVTDEFVLVVTPNDPVKASWVLDVRSLNGALKTGTFNASDSAQIGISSGFGTDLATCGGGLGSVTISALTLNPNTTGSSDRFLDLVGNFSVFCGNAGTAITGSFAAHIAADDGGGGGGGGGGGNGGGGSGTGTIGLPPGLGVPSPVGSPDNTVPAAPLAPRLTVTVPPIASANAIELGSSDVAVLAITAFGNAAFSAPVTLSAKSDPPGLTFNFSNNNFPAPGTSLSNLTIGTTSQTVPGVYNVTVTATGGGISNSQTFRITVFCDPPYILGSDQPKGSSVTRGTTAKLTASAHGSGPMRFEWFAGHAGSTAFPLTNSNDPVLTTPVINDTSEFWYRVSNDCGSANSQTAVVTTK